MWVTATCYNQHMHWNQLQSMHAFLCAMTARLFGQLLMHIGGETAAGCVKTAGCIACALTYA